LKDPRPQPIYRRDYRPPDYLIDDVELRFELDASATLVASRLRVRARDAASAGPLVLHGEKLDLRKLAIDGAVLPRDAYRVDGEVLTIFEVPTAFVLEVEVVVSPRDNTELSGLYLSGDTFCTQCEAEGFRRITYFLDRPDVMARYRTTIVADKARFPVLLSNGNRVDSGELDGGRHFVCWEDPFPKPSYLFALVAADLRCHGGSFLTRSGRDVRLEIWVEPRHVDACEHALRSLQKAMAWDEEEFGREYDLDIYMIVAVSDFNMGAMENKGLNIFNAKYVLARPETATDDDYEDIEGVIAHEYFHNWTGNRVTCRDWFQLTLKEGLTVFRDEQFTADMTSAAVKRIQDVKTLRTAQFAEDQSPTAHPIRPDAYIEMNNFYTVTVYNKGAEVIRMFHTLLGAEGFRKGMDLYFERHDGQAVTCDDFRAAMADANGVDLEQFGRWYGQAGTPIVTAHGHHDADDRRYTLTLEQRAASNVDLEQWSALHVPVAVGLLGPDGRDLPLRVSSSSQPGPIVVRGTTAILELREPTQTFVFENVDVPPVASLLRGFSAPVKLEHDRSLDELAFAMGNDADAFCRWDAGQTLAQHVLLELTDEAAQGRPLRLDPRLGEAWGRVLDDPALDGSLKALTLTLPDERLLGQQMEVIEVDGIHQARQFAVGALARAHRQALHETYDRLRLGGGDSIDRDAIDGRRLKNTCLRHLVALGDDADGVALALAQFHAADNMTDAQAALTCLTDTESSARDEALAAFHAKWRHEALVLDKWFSVQALSSRPDTLDRVIELASHPDFTLRNPNRVRSLLGVFAVRNQARFHAADGRAYTFLADRILELDPLNPQVAARLVGAFNQWRRFDETRRDSMRAQLDRIVRHPGLSKDVYELASKCLG
jgi:aminopeptidase N